MYSDDMIIPNGFGQVTFIYGGSGVPTGAVNTFGFNNGAGDTPSAAATEFANEWGNLVMPSLVQNVDLVGTLVKLGPNNTGPSALVGISHNGEDLSAQAPPNVAYLVNKITGLGGRRGRGRVFLPGVDETVVTQGGFVDAAKVTQIQNGLDQFVLNMAAHNLGLVVLHSPAKIWTLVNGRPRQIDDPNAPAPPLPSAITSLQVSAQVATQRRRVRR